MRPNRQPPFSSRHRPRGRSPGEHFRRRHERQPRAAQSLRRLRLARRGAGRRPAGYRLHRAALSTPGATPLQGRARWSACVRLVPRTNAGLLGSGQRPPLGRAPDQPAITALAPVLTRLCQRLRAAHRTGHVRLRTAARYAVRYGLRPGPGRSKPPLRARHARRAGQPAWTPPPRRPAHTVRPDTRRRSVPPLRTARAITPRLPRIPAKHHAPKRNPPPAIISQTTIMPVAPFPAAIA